MLYAKSLTIPAGTPSDNPKETTIEIEEPILLYAAVKFPPGCHDMVSAAIFYGKLQILPSKKGEWIKGDNETVSDYPMIEFTTTPETLTLKGYAPNTDYDHTLIFRFVALERKWVKWMIALSRLVQMWEAFIKLIGLRT